MVILPSYLALVYTVNSREMNYVCCCLQVTELHLLYHMLTALTLYRMSLSESKNPGFFQLTPVLMVIMMVKVSQ